MTFGYGLNLHNVAVKSSELAEPDATPIALMILGGLVFLVAFFGCCGAFKESSCMLRTVRFQTYWRTIFRKLTSIFFFAVFDLSFGFTRSAIVFGLPCVRKAWCPQKCFRIEFAENGEWLWQKQFVSQVLRRSSVWIFVLWRWWPRRLY